MANKQSLRIYLAHLDHPKFVSRIAVPINIAYIASYCDQQFGKDAKVSMFTDAEELMEKIQSTPPHILALSYYMWNVNLTRKVIECCRKLSPNTIIVIGGPSVSRISDSYKELLNQNYGLDIVSLDHGEKAFAAVVKRVLSTGMNRKKIFDNPIDGCASRINGTNDIVRGIDINNMKGLENTPSPYLNGYMDKFLSIGQWPMLETNRGCPYLCTFCERGDIYFSKLMIRDENIIYEELNYLAKHSKAKELIITDSNFGLLGERDLRIIQKIEEMKQTVNFPSIITDVAAPKVETKYSIEVMKAVSRVSERYYYGLQTLTDLVLGNSKRQNISLGAIEKLAGIAREADLPVTVDLIFGLPGETVQSFMETTSKLISLGVQPSVYNLRVLPGTEIAEGDRENYQYKTKFRPFNNRYGEYRLMPNEKTYRVIETEEVACENTTINNEDYMFIRKYGVLVDLMSCFGAFTDALFFLGIKGITVEKINQYILKNYESHPRLAKLFNEYEVYSNNELSPNEEELLQTICENDEEWESLILQKGRYFKLNLGFAGYCLLGDIRTLVDFETLIIDYAKPALSDDELKELNELFKICRYKRIINERNESWSVDKKLKPLHIVEKYFVEEEFDIDKWLKTNCKGPLSNFRHDKPLIKNYRIKHYEKLLGIIEKSSKYSSYNHYEKILLAASNRILLRSGN